MKFKKVCSVLSVPFLVANFVNFNYVSAGKGKLNAEYLRKVCNYISICDEMNLWRAVQEETCYLSDGNFVLNLPENIKWRMLMDVQYQYGDEGMYALDRCDKDGYLESDTKEPGYINALLNAWNYMTESIQKNKKLNANLYIKLHDLAVEKVCIKILYHNHIEATEKLPENWIITPSHDTKFVKAKEYVYAESGLAPKYSNVNFGLCVTKKDKLGNFTNKGLEEFKRKQTETDWFDGIENQLLKDCRYDPLTYRVPKFYAPEFENEEITKNLLNQIFDQYYKKLEIINAGKSLKGSFLPENSSMLDKKFELIIRTCQDLDQAHVFADGNIRTIVFLVMNKMLIENKLNPTCMYDPNVLDCTDIETLIEHVKTGQAYFSGLKNGLIELV